MPPPAEIGVLTAELFTAVAVHSMVASRWEVPDYTYREVIYLYALII
jgi:hypothetical protein